jgi:hypothetical protein
MTLVRGPEDDAGPGADPGGEVDGTPRMAPAVMAPTPTANRRRASGPVRPAARQANIVIPPPNTGTTAPVSAVSVAIPGPSVCSSPEQVTSGPDSRAARAP